MHVPQISCYADGGGFVAPAGGHAARALAALPAIRRAHDPAALGSPSAGDVAQLVQAAGTYALAAGWVQRVDGYWLCPTHAGIYLDSDPKHFTIRECLHRHRIRHRD
ncbi:MAG TPA: hypothetical protein VFX70_13815 [Mycobacteriales bacterium]|nr:hypothetical protein [Mycobacteriales bacterium]